MTNVSSTIDSALTMVMGDDMVKVSLNTHQLLVLLVFVEVPPLVMPPVFDSTTFHPPAPGGCLVRQRVGLLPARGRPG